MKGGEDEAAPEEVLSCQDACHGNHGKLKAEVKKREGREEQNEESRETEVVAALTAPLEPLPELHQGEHRRSTLQRERSTGEKDEKPDTEEEENLCCQIEFRGHSLAADEKVEKCEEHAEVQSRERQHVCHAHLAEEFAGFRRETASVAQRQCGEEGSTRFCEVCVKGFHKAAPHSFQTVAQFERRLSRQEFPSFGADVCDAADAVMNEEVAIALPLFALFAGQGDLGVQGEQVADLRAWFSLQREAQRVSFAFSFHDGDVAAHFVRRFFHHVLDLHDPQRCLFGPGKQHAGVGEERQRNRCGDESHGGAEGGESFAPFPDAAFPLAPESKRGNCSRKSNCQKSLWRKCRVEQTADPNAERQKQKRAQKRGRREGLKGSQSDFPHEKRMVFGRVL